MNDHAPLSSSQPFNALVITPAAEGDADVVGSALALATEQFRAYAKDHHRKAEMHRHKAGSADSMVRENRLEDAAESERKAKVNEDMADMIENALLAHTASLPTEPPENPYADLAPHMQRVAVERDELSEKTDKLEAFINGEAFAGLPEDTRFDLVDQLSVMVKYRAILNIRLAK